LDYFAHCPHVNRLVAYEDLHWILFGDGRLPWMPDRRGANRLGAWLRRHAPNWVRRPYRCDTAILPVISPFPEYHRILRELPAAERLGVCGNLSCQSDAEDRESRPWYTRQLDASAWPWNFSELEANRRFLEFLGAPASNDEVWPEFWTTAEDRRQAEQWLPADPARLTLALAPGVISNPRKNLPALWFAHALQKLTGRPLRVVLFGSPADQLACAVVAQILAPLANVRQILDLTGKTTVRELIECFRRCDLVFCQETAALHVATALHKPVAGILGGGHFGRFYPWGDPRRARVVNQPMDCYGCNWVCKYDTIRCVQEIPPAAATRVLQELADGLAA
jgi:ADP-heptose:LPS heptosyltransferase